MKIPSFPADEVHSAVSIIGNDDGLLKMIQELRGLANDVKPIVSLFGRFKEGYMTGQENRPKSIAARAGETTNKTQGASAQAGQPAAGLTPDEIHLIVRDDMRQIILYYLDMAVKMGYGDKTLAEAIQTANIKINDIKAMLAG